MDVEKYICKKDCVGWVRVGGLAHCVQMKITSKFFFYISSLWQHPNPTSWWLVRWQIVIWCKERKEGLENYKALHTF